MEDTSSWTFCSSVWMSAIPLSRTLCKRWQISLAANFQESVTALLMTAGESMASAAWPQGVSRMASGRHPHGLRASAAWPQGISHLASGHQRPGVRVSAARPQGICRMARGHQPHGLKVSATWPQASAAGPQGISHMASGHHAATWPQGISRMA